MLRPAGEIDFATAADAFGPGQIVRSVQQVVLRLLRSDVYRRRRAGRDGAVAELVRASGGVVELIALPPKIERIFVLGGLQMLLVAR